MNFVAIDFETANEKRYSACAIGTAIVSNGEIVLNESLLIRPPELYFNPRNIELHGITEDDVSDLPTFDEIWPNLKQVFDKNIIIAHNASFDISVLRNILDFYGIRYPEFDYYCTLVMARKVWPDFPNHKLDTIAAKLGLKFNHHDAKDDAYICAKIALACKKNADCSTLEELANKLNISKGKLYVGGYIPCRKDGNYLDNNSNPLNFNSINQKQVFRESQFGPIFFTVSKTGIQKYYLKISHKKLGKFKDVKDDDPDIVERKAMVEMANWDEMWQKRVQTEKLVNIKETKKNKAVRRTEEAKATLSSLEKILEHTLSIDDTVNWKSLKNYSDYPKPKPAKPMLPPKPVPPNIPPIPNPSAFKYKPKLTFWDKFVPSKMEAKYDFADRLFEYDTEMWKENKQKEIKRANNEVKSYNEKLQVLQKQYTYNVKQWEVQRAKYIKKRDEINEAIDERRDKYLSGNLGTVIDYCEIVLTKSEYPDYFSKEFELDYNPENKIMIVDYQLPALSQIPRLCEVKYVASKDDFTEKFISDSKFNALYDSVQYQIALRTIHELYEADVINALESIVFNGFVKSIDPATGKKTNGCVLSMQANKNEFLEINLANIEPKACFRKLKGVGSSKLHSLTPIRPILQIDREDKRFVDSYDVADSINEGDNLAAMDWEDFEHLIRELFAKEFSAAGGEVKVTRASHDGGVDAIAFDPDPIRGGKIAIQAKRYTGTVGVSAVRDLYGTVMNEGANKGILVTTSSYGPDAYEFAKGKPLTLLNGGNLLHLLEKHGHKAKIDIQEAKRLLAEKEE